MYKNFKSENLKKKQHTIIIIPYWWDGKLPRYGNNEQVIS
jgi:hypothetical protein